MSKGYVYTKDINGTKETVVLDSSTGKTITLSSFSGYLAFSGNLISEGMKKSGAVGSATPIGKAYAVLDGVVSGDLDA